MLMRALPYFLYRLAHPRAESTVPDTSPASGVDWRRYMGRWYEIARFETPFELGLDAVWADYEWCGQGRVRIANGGVDASGRVHRAFASAVPVDDGVLLVSFVPLLRILATPYHVLKVDESYRYALVSNENGSCMWLLARKPLAPLSELWPLLQDAIRRGFNLRLLRPTVQDRCAFCGKIVRK